MEKELREQLLQLIGEYTATVMVDNPNWVFDPKPAIKLADSIVQVVMSGVWIDEMASNWFEMIRTKQINPQATLSHFIKAEMGNSSQTL